MTVDKNAEKKADEDNISRCTGKNQPASGAAKGMAGKERANDHTTAGDKQQKWVETMERAEVATTNHQRERQRLMVAGNKSKGQQLAIGNETGWLLSCDNAL